MINFGYQLQAELDLLRRVLTGLACFDEEYCVGLAASAASLCDSEYVTLNLAAAAEIARRHGLIEVADWLRRSRNPRTTGRVARAPLPRSAALSLTTVMH
jgi:hypothetical protein